MSDHPPEQCRQIVRVEEDWDRESGVVWSWRDEVRHCPEHQNLDMNRTTGVGPWEIGDETSRLQQERDRAVALLERMLFDPYDSVNIANAREFLEEIAGRMDS